MPASPELSPGLIVIHGNHLEELRALAVQWMRRYPLRPSGPHGLQAPL